MTRQPFDPNDLITREQAMAIIARAMKITGLTVALTDGNVSTLIGTYTDGESASDYAEDRAIDEALEYSPDKERFILNMEYEGYEVRWDDTHKYILFTTPEGKKCLDRTLHDETYLKETLEKLFAYRAEHGYAPQTPEPPEGWLEQANSMGKLASDAIRLGKSVEKMADVPLPLTPFTPIDSKQKRREALKKLAQGHKLQNEQEQEFVQKM